MEIRIKPEEIVKRCLWDSYVYYIIGSEKEAKEILEKNEEFTIKETDALVIGLIRVIETNNLVHKFNTHISDLLANRSMKRKKLMINKRILNSSIEKFMNKFPDYWETDIVWEKSLKELKEYVSGVNEKISKLEVFGGEVNGYEIEMYSTNSIKKLLKFNYL